MTLDSVAFDVPVQVVGFVAIAPHDLERLAALGLRLGTTTTKIVRTPLRDPVECLVGTQLLALERRLLKSIQVQPL